MKIYQATGISKPEMSNPWMMMDIRKFPKHMENPSKKRSQWIWGKKMPNNHQI